MKRAVSVSLGQPSRDKRVIVTFKGTPIDIERIGTGGDDRRARRLLAELDGTVDVLAVGGIVLLSLAWALGHFWLARCPPELEEG